MGTAAVRPGERIDAAQSGTVGGLSGAVLILGKKDAPDDRFLVSAAHVLCESPFACAHAARPVKSAIGREVAEHHGGQVAVSLRCDIGFALLDPAVDVEAPLALPHLLASETAPTGKVADRTYPGAWVWKYGAATGLTRGRVASTSTVRLRYPDGVHELPVAVIVSESDEPFSSKGDSGSVVYYQSGEALGVLIAGRDSGSRAYVSPLTEVVRMLELL